MHIVTRILYCALICVLALVVGRSIAHESTSAGAAAYGYDNSASYALQSTDGMTDTLTLSVQDDQSITATPIVLSPYPTIVLLSPTTGLTVTAASITPKVVSSQSTPTSIVQSTVASTSSTGTPISTEKPTKVVLSPTNAIKASATITATAAASSRSEYTVKRGDTLLGIAKSFNTTAKAILEINQDIADPEQLRIGQVLRIP